MRIEPATAAHLPGVRAIAATYGNLDDWPARPDWLDFLLREHALWAALDGAAVVGYAGVVGDGGVQHLADLFVARDRLGAGIGGRLLAAALPQHGVRTTYASGDERAVALYVRAGLRPLAPLLYLDGAVPPAAAERIAVTGALAADAAASGRPRPALLDFLAEAGAYALTTGSPGAYAIVRPAATGARIGPAAGSAADLLAFAGAVSSRHGRAALALPGPHPAVRALLAAGCRYRGMDTVMATADGVLKLQAYVPDTDLG